MTAAAESSAATEQATVAPAASTSASPSPFPLPASPALSNTAIDRARHRVHEHGNYYGYYGFRTQTIPDARLSLLPRELFADRRILDLGCNAGKLTLEVLNHLGATRARGVDIDAHLISQAEAATNAEHVEWTVGDFMEENYEFGDWDTIMLLSITKWLHLHHGDEGMRKLFRRLFEVLPKGGALLVEPQERENYASAARKNKNLRPAYKSIQMWPPFEEELKAVGFSLEDCIEREEGGFSRPLMIWRKPL